MLEIPTNIVSSELDDEMIIMDLNSGEYFSLNEYGLHVWKEIEINKRGNIAEIIEALKDKFTVTKESELQIKELIESLLAQKLLHEKK